MTNRWFLRTRSRFARVLPARYDHATVLFELTESITAVLGLCCSWVTLADHSQLHFLAAVSQALAELERDHGQPYPPVPVLEAPIDTPRLWASRSSTGPCATRAGAVEDDSPNRHSATNGRRRRSVWRPAGCLAFDEGAHVLGYQSRELRESSTNGRALTHGLMAGAPRHGQALTVVL
jgi:hypothetical protein